MVDALDYFRKLYSRDANIAWPSTKVKSVFLHAVFRVSSERYFCEKNCNKYCTAEAVVFHIFMAYSTFPYYSLASWSSYQFEDF
jgi:hypothetical protein